eukprot:3226385-Lingulodinium_polyedra.AAC.1
MSVNVSQCQSGVSQCQSTSVIQSISASQCQPVSKHLPMSASEPVLFGGRQSVTSGNQSVNIN